MSGLMSAFVATRRSGNDRSEFFSNGVPDDERGGSSGESGERIGGCAVIVCLAEVNAVAHKDHQRTDERSGAGVQGDHGI